MKVSILLQNSTGDTSWNKISHILEASIREAGHEIGLESPDSTVVKVEYFTNSFVPGNSFEKTTYKCEIFATIITPEHGSKETQTTEEKEYPMPTTPKDDELNRESTSANCAKRAALQIIEALSNL